MNKNNFGKKINEKIRKLKFFFCKNKKKRKKERGKTLWITVVIHNVLCVGEQ